MRIALHASLLVLGACAAHYDERLDVRDLGGALVVHALFEHRASLRLDQAICDYGTFPRRLAEAVLAGDVAECPEGRVMASLVAGRWHGDAWGRHPVASDWFAVSPGSELVVSHTAAQSFPRLASFFGVLIAANFDGQSVPEDTDRVRSSLPEEGLCAENVRPLLDMQPCGRTRGVAAALGAPRSLHDAGHNAIVLDVQWSRADEVLTLHAAINIVVAVDYARRGKECERVLSDIITFAHEWSPCIMAKTPIGCAGGACSLLKAAVDDAGVKKSVSISRVPPLDAPPVSLTRTLAGTGRVRRELVLVWTNSTDASLDIVHSEILCSSIATPFLYAIASTFPVDVSVQSLAGSKLVTLSFALPQHTSMIVRIPLHIRMPNVADAPPAPHRGTVLPAGVSHMRTVEGGLLRMTSSGAGPSIVPPVADSTMPYNVVTLSATALALLFGTLLNALFRRFGVGRPPIVEKLFRLRTLLQRLFARS